MSALIAVLAFIATLGLLITFHEFGHFYVARKCGVKVLRFSVGFGKPLWRYQAKSGTEYCIACIPLGGYVKMLDEREGDVPADQLPYAFNRKSVWQRIAIVLAGPVFNFIFAIAAFALVYAIGTRDFAAMVDTVTVGSAAEQAGLLPHDEIIAINDTPVYSQPSLVRAFLREENPQDYRLTVHYEGEQRAVTLPASAVPSVLEEDFFDGLGFTLAVPAWIGEVLPGSAAAQAGLQAGDKVQAIDGQVIHNWYDFVRVVANAPGQPLQVTVNRAGQPLTLTAVPQAGEQAGMPVGLLGVAIDESLLRTLRENILMASWRGVADTGFYSVLTLKIIGQMIIGQVGLEQISGPVTIAVYAGETAQIGLVYFLQFLALISISLGVLNLLPIPMLDGGHLLYYVIEIIQGKPVSLKTQQIGLAIGLVLLVSLMALAFYNDIVRLSLFG